MSQAAGTESVWYPWLPAIDPTVDASLAVDSFVTPRVPLVPVSETPGAPPFRWDNGDPDPSTHPLMGFQKGLSLVVVHGPVVVDKIEWYLLTTAGVGIDIPIGWAPYRSPTGQRLLEPLAYDCPSSPIDESTLIPAVLTDGLPACYGHREITIVGELTCEDTPDPFVVGATWLAGGACRFGAPPTVYGLKPGLKPGRYAVTGRFLDEDAQACRSADGDDSDIGRLTAVLQCRRAFVATAARPAER